MEASLEEKQQYLYNEIIEGQKDPAEFQEFLEHQKSLDLNEWSMK